MPKQRPETREKVQRTIEDAALALLAERGFEATGMRDVAEAAGMSPASLYNHYPSKEALFAAVVARYRSGVLDESGDNPLYRYMRACRFPHDLTELARALEAVVVRDRAYLVLWYIDLLSFSGRHFRNELMPTLLMTAPGLRARLDELRRTRALRVDPDVAFRMAYVHLFNFFLVVHVFDKGDFFGGEAKKRAAVEQIVDVLQHGMLADSEPKHRARKPR